MELKTPYCLSIAIIFIFRSVAPIPAWQLIRRRVDMRETNNAIMSKHANARVPNATRKLPECCPSRALCALEDSSLYVPRKIDDVFHVPKGVRMQPIYRDDFQHASEHDK